MPLFAYKKKCVHYQRNGNAWRALSGNNAFDESGLSYDKNGNILTLTRTGSAAVTQTYTYTGNQLTGLSRGNVTGSYRYDKNGNLVNDIRKNLNLTYNVLNLLSVVKTGTTPTATYSYLADGTKLEVVDGSDHGFCYLGSLTYVRNGSNVQLESGLFAGGRIVANASSRVGNEIRYFLTDHLGSVRVIVDQLGAVKERNDYYPFGGRYGVSGGNVDAGSRWKYNGKEDQVTGGLDWLDYGARMYDWELGRWFGMDPLSENYYSCSVYNYCLNQPTRYIDPNGMWVDEWNLNIKTGELTWFSDLGGIDVQYVNFVFPHANGGLKWLGSSYIEGASIYSGPIAENYNGDFSYGVSNKDLWSDVPDVYQGHYLAWDLKLRFCYANMKNQDKINSIRLQEAMGLERLEMIWNTSDEYKRIVNKYNTDASFVMALEYGMLPLPVGNTDVISYVQGSLSARQSVYFSNTSTFKGSQYFKNIAVYSTQPILSNNPWIRFLQMNKGKFKGSNWLNEARQAYFQTKR